MAAYSRAGVYTSTGNPLCDKLKQQLAARNAATAVRRAVSTSEMLRRVQRGLDPYENAPNPLTERKQASRPTSAAELSRRQIADTRRPVKQNGAQTPAMSRTAQPARAQADTRSHTARPTGTKVVPRGETVRSVFSTEAKRIRSAVAAAKNAKAETPMTEVRLARAPFPFAALVMLTIFTVMVMVIVYSFAQNYELTSEIASLEAQRQVIIEEESMLSLQLEERNDIRLIEDIALNEIGMVKNDLVENRFITVSGGNRVELLNAEEDVSRVNENIFSTMLSAIAENFSKVREYID